MTKSPALMWAKLAAIAAVTITVLYLMFVPVSTTTVTLEVPHGMPANSVPAFFDGIAVFATAFSWFVFALIVAAAIWMARRVIRHHRHEG